MKTKKELEQMTISELIDYRVLLADKLVNIPIVVSKSSFVENILELQNKGLLEHIPDFPPKPLPTEIRIIKEKDEGTDNPDVGHTLLSFFIVFYCFFLLFLLLFYFSYCLFFLGVAWIGLLVLLLV